MPTIIALVEGDGEVQAVPILIRRIAEVATLGFFPDVPKPIRVRRDSILKPGEIERYVELAANQAGPNGRILILLDADDDCPRDLAPGLLRRAAAVRSDRRIQVVMARMEYEAWFLAAADSLAGSRGFGDDITAPGDPESIRNAKGWLTERMPPGRAYKELRDQPALTARFDLEQARRSESSFDKLWRDVSSLLAPTRVQP